MQERFLSVYDDHTNFRLFDSSIVNDSHLKSITVSTFSYSDFHLSFLAQKCVIKITIANCEYIFNSGISYII